MRLRTSSAYSAPVHFPRIWNASWFEWVQYNGSIEQPMTRNAGEALGVRAAVNLTGGRSDVVHFQRAAQNDLRNRTTSRRKLRRPMRQTGFIGLRSPKWPANILPPINTELAAKGAVLVQRDLPGLPHGSRQGSGVLDLQRWSAAEFRGRALPRSASKLT